MEVAEDPKIITIKVAMLGESGVGKTCIIDRYASNTFNEYSEPTKGASFKSKTIKAKDGTVEVKLHMWDTAGQEIYRSLAPFYYKDADAVIVVYDITSQKSFDALGFWISEWKQHSPQNCLLTIVGNKSDKIEEEKVSPASGKALADEKNATHYTVSAKENLNINEVFLDIIARRLPTMRDKFGLEGAASGIDSDIISGPEKNKVKLKNKNKDSPQKKPCC